MVFFSFLLVSIGKELEISSRGMISYKSFFLKSFSLLTDVRIGTNLSNFFHIWTWTFWNWFNNLIHLAEVQSIQIHSRIAWNRPSVFYLNHCSMSKKSKNGSFLQQARVAPSGNPPWHPQLTPEDSGVLVNWFPVREKSVSLRLLWLYRYDGFIYAYTKAVKNEAIAYGLYKISTAYGLT